MKNFKLVLTSALLAIAFLVSPQVNAQDDQDSTEYATQTPPKPKKDLKDKIYYGGNFGMTFGTYTRINISPMIAYKLTPALSVGTVLSYEYFRDRNFNTTYEGHNYGYSLFSRLKLLKGVYAHAEFQHMNYDLQYEEGLSTREWVPYFLVGGGISRRMGGNTWFNVQVLFDVLQNERSPYGRYEPIYGAGIGVGF